jgi:hypothetical protein
MRGAGVLGLLVATIGLSGCGGPLQSQTQSQAAPAKWTTGFWFWRGSEVDTTLHALPVDVLYVEAGSIDKPFPRAPWRVWGDLPRDLPQAREYWIVFRCERQQVPNAPIAPELARRISQLHEGARQKGWNVAGVQLDIDSPTAVLPQYAKFLQEVRKGLPKNAQVSITALLDWFRDGTAIADVVKEVDEFVPQFYDAESTPLPNDLTSIAAKIDAAKWGPRFNRFGKRYRIGVSTFGRARLVAHPNYRPKDYFGSIYRDLMPLDVATNPAFAVETTRNQANELVVKYVASRDAKIEWNRFAPGEAIQFTLPTAETVQSAVQSAKQMRGCAGVVFFRWPGENDALVMQPDEVLVAASGAPTATKVSSVETVDGSCAAVSCVDVYLMNAKPLAPSATHFRIKSSAEFEYFLPQKNVPVKMVGSMALGLSLPPFTGQHRLFLGRAVTAKAARFSVEEVQ